MHEFRITMVDGKKIRVNSRARRRGAKGLARRGVRRFLDLCRSLRYGRCEPVDRQSNEPILEDRGHSRAARALAPWRQENSGRGAACPAPIDDESGER